MRVHSLFMLITVQPLFLCLIAERLGEGADLYLLFKPRDPVRAYRQFAHSPRPESSRG